MNLPLRICAVTLWCCLSACGPGGSEQDQNKKDPLHPGGDPCAAVDPAVCDATKGCQLVTSCPACPAGEACPTVCQVECQSIPTPPPPSRCEGLDEATCSATKGCQPLYGGVCPACIGPGCPPCTTGYLGCTEVVVPPPPPPDHCAGLDERSCNRTSGCLGVYTACPDTAICACPAGVDCAKDPTIFAGCQLDAVVCGGGTEPGAPPPAP